MIVDAANALHQTSRRLLLGLKNVLDKVTKPLYVTEAFMLYRIMHS